MFDFPSPVNAKDLHVPVSMFQVLSPKLQHLRKLHEYI